MCGVFICEKNRPRSVLENCMGNSFYMIRRGRNNRFCEISAVCGAAAVLAENAVKRSGAA